MVATDTIVGIVGAVVLVAVMAGVFVYEYNNESDVATDAELQEHFEEDYDGLAALQDMDGDGEANWKDLDIDGDGVNNTEDDMLSKVETIDVGLDAPTGGPTTGSYTFQVVNGSESLKGTLQYTRGPGGQFPVVSGTLSGPDGFDPVTLSFSNGGSGNTYTANIDIAEPLPAGEYTLSFSNTGAGGLVPLGQAAQVDGTVEVHYATPADGHSH